MNEFFMYLNIDGVQTLIEFHYELGLDNRSQVIQWFDIYGDTPEIPDDEMERALITIDEFESQRPLGYTDQQYLNMEFNGTAI